MQPYYSDDAVTIYHADCREILPNIAVDAMVTDPPYGVGMEAFEDDFTVSVQGLHLCNARRAAIFMSPRRVIELAIALSPRWRYERLLWMHKSADIAAPWRGWAMNSEAIMIMSRDRTGWPPASSTRSDLYSVGPWERAGHPNGKPLTVIRDLVTRLAAPSDLILDPFMGSGTTMRAAKDLGRTSIGVEIDERYCEIAARRMGQEVLAL